MAEEKEFVSFFEKPHKLIAHETSFTGKANLIKGEHVDAGKSVEKVNWKDVSGQAPDIVVIEKEGRVEALEIKCNCGCHSTVQFEYEEPEQVKDES